MMGHATEARSMLSIVLQCLFAECHLMKAMPDHGTALQEASGLDALSDKGQDCEELAASCSTGPPRTPEQAQAQLREVEQLLAKSRTVHAGKAESIIALSRSLL